MKITFFNHPSIRNRTTLLAVISLSLIMSVLPGCSEKKQSAETAASSKADAQKVVIKGSNTIGEELGPRLIAEYRKDHPAAAFELESKGTGSGLWALVANQCDLAAASRAINAEELKQANERGMKLDEHTIGSYSVAVVVHADNPVKDLTKDQVRDLFTGVIQNWKDVGGPDAPVHLYIRDPVSGTHLGFKELAMENKPYSAGTNALTSYAAIVQAVAQDAYGIGYSSIDLANKPGVKTVSIGGVTPSAATVNEGKYPYARMLRFYTSKGKEASSATDFIKFVQSPKGQEIVARTGNVPRP